MPSAQIIDIIGALAVAANLFCVSLLSRHRRDDIDMRSAWLCSRNDVVANAGVLLAAAGVRLTGAGWPDIAVGVVIAVLFVGSAVGVVRAARRQLHPAPSQ